MEECRAVSLYVYQWLADNLPPPIINGRATVSPISAGEKPFLLVETWYDLHSTSTQGVNQ
jgi:hypothetical protein